MKNVETEIAVKLSMLGASEGSKFFSSAIGNPVYQGYEMPDLFLLSMQKELDSRRNAKASRCLKSAKLLSTCANIDAIEYTPERNLDQKLIERLSTNAYIADHTNICIVGSSGTGKTFIGKALAVQACWFGFRTKVISFLKLVRELSQLRGGKNTDAYEKRLRFYSRIPLLMIDDWLCEPLKPDQVACMLELIEERYQTHTTIVCSQLPLANWPKVCGNQALGESILGRLKSNSFRIELDGNDLREKHKSKP